MLISTFWNIFLKIIAIITLLKFINQIPQTIYEISNMKNYGDFSLEMMIYILLIPIFQILIVILFTFKSSFFIKLLKLEDNFNEEKIDLNLDYYSIFVIASIVCGIILFVQNIPSFLNEVLQNLKLSNMGQKIDDKSTMIYNLIKLLISMLLIFKYNLIANLLIKQIEEKNKN